MANKEKQKARKAPVIDLNDDEFGMMLNCAVRYACGRRTYMPGAVIRFVAPLLPYLSDKTLWCFDQDIASARRYENCGDEQIDLPNWVAFHEAVRSERIKRGEEPYKGWWEDCSQ